VLYIHIRVLMTISFLQTHARASVLACVFDCVCACVSACVRARAYVYARVCEVRRILLAYHLLYLFFVLLIEYDKRPIVYTCRAVICANTKNDIFL